MTKSMKQYRERLVMVGCIVCRNLGFLDSPAEIHHLRNGRGMAQRSNDENAIPLCPQHHRLGGLGVAFHAGKESWESMHGTERQLLEQVKAILNGGIMK